MKLKQITFLLIGFLIVGNISCQQSRPKNLLNQLQEIPGVSVKKISGDSTFTEYYELYFTQDLDHQNPKAGTFQQRVLLGHHAFNQPMVVQLEGYQIWSDKAGELSKLLNANQLTIEHRYFKNSMPDSLNWQYLNIKQAAADQHAIIQALKKLYPNKWLTTGISKGGQTTIYHRYFYPNDVDVSVPYVAPHNLAREDKRIQNYLASAGNQEIRDKIRQFQLTCFKNREKLLPLAEAYAKEKNYSFTMGLARALDLSILEYPFAYWQWGGIDEIPDENANPQELSEHLFKVSNIDFFDVNNIKTLLAFYHQALTEIGMYSYEIAPFKQYLNDEKDITFDFTFPNEPIRKFDASSMIKINKWLQTDAEKILFIYGENDTWSATAVDLKGNNKCKKFVNPEGSHKSRINSFPSEMKKEILNTLEEWMDVQLTINNEK
ncbi:S28 family serine protease [Labilibaculum sp.]|uniref:S28 family serine protease n=1 Tax=Labilibaculum sp. TaxID=2060723 RepID=UPI002AA8ABDC|nr:S28 family serine protease [Labilibaculum sp.]MBN2598170.1 peptidase [Marinifilaceae bacterium]